MTFGPSKSTFIPGQKVDWLNRKTGKKEVYDFGYYSQVEDKAVIYEEGEMNMQDSYAVEIADLSPHSELPEDNRHDLQVDPTTIEDRSGYGNKSSSVTGIIAVAKELLVEIKLIEEHFNPDGSPKTNDVWRLGSIGSSIRRIRELLDSRD